jgi:hypothetical protein
MEGLAMPADGSHALALDEETEIQVDPLEATLDSPALARLLAEVRGEETEVSRSYNRTYNRHNR